MPKKIGTDQIQIHKTKEKYYKQVRLISNRVCLPKWV